MKRINWNKAIIILAGLMLVLTACSKSNNKSTTKKSDQLPSATKILSTAEKTSIKSLSAKWQQTNSTGVTTQSATAKYQKKPLVVYANFSTDSNHYKMWVSGKTNYSQDQGTDTSKWFKTKLTKTSAYSEFLDALDMNNLLSFSAQTAKLFKVAKNGSGYLLTYQGKNSQLWKQVINNSAITTMIGIDLNSAKMQNIAVQLKVSHDYQAESMRVSAKYREDGKNYQLKMTLTDINRLKQLKVPSTVTQNAINLSSSN